MKMIIGGAYQGQTAWAMEQYKNIHWTDGSVCEFPEVFSCGGIVNFHTYIRRLLQAEWDRPEQTGFQKEKSKQGDISTRTLAKQLILKNPDIIIVSNEIGYGLVPVEAFDRQYREQTGRICTELAAFSDQVIRMVMGIGTQIK